MIISRQCLFLDLIKELSLFILYLNSSFLLPFFLFVYALCVLLLRQVLTVAVCVDRDAVRGVHQ